MLIFFGTIQREVQSYKTAGNYLSLLTEHDLNMWCALQHAECLTSQIFPCQSRSSTWSRGYNGFIPWKTASSYCVFQIYSITGFQTCLLNVSIKDKAGFIPIFWAFELNIHFWNVFLRLPLLISLFRNKCWVSQKKKYCLAFLFHFLSFCKLFWNQRFKIVNRCSNSN